MIWIRQGRVSPSSLPINVPQVPEFEATFECRLVWRVLLPELLLVGTRARSANGFDARVLVALRWAAMRTDDRMQRLFKGNLMTWETVTLVVLVVVLRHGPLMTEVGHLCIRFLSASEFGGRRAPPKEP